MKKELREAVFNRDQNCVKCGRTLYDEVAVHHRKLRKHGGADDIVNLIALCSTCHNIAPESVHQNPKNSYEAGYLVKSWQNPEEVPVLLANGNKVLLSNDGKYKQENGEEYNGW